MSNPEFHADKVLIEVETRIQSHLDACCREILDWQNTGILCDGQVREAARLVHPVLHNYALPYVEKQVTRAAMQRCAGWTTKRTHELETSR